MAATDGWTPVLPTSGAAFSELRWADRRKAEEEAFREWAKKADHTPSLGDHISDKDKAWNINRAFKGASALLGRGGFAEIRKVTHVVGKHRICLARKCIQVQRGQDPTRLLEEARVMNKLRHEHVLRLIFTYSYKPSELCLLLWPVAVSTLKTLLEDVDLLRTPDLHFGEREEILQRMEALELGDLSLVTPAEDTPTDAQQWEPSDKCPLRYLQRILGCLARGSAYMHREGVRHQDIKTENILLNPGSVYLADFGVSQDVEGWDHTAIDQFSGTRRWCPPEKFDAENMWQMAKADVYSLGLVFVNVCAVVYGVPLDDFNDALAIAAFKVVKRDNVRQNARHLALLDFQAKVEQSAVSSRGFANPNDATVAPKHLMALTRDMLSLDPADRPTMDVVDETLVALGGIDQIYHERCCRKPARHITNLIDTKISAVAQSDVALKNTIASMQEAQVALQAKLAETERELNILRSTKDTYEQRIKNERAQHAAQIKAEMERTAEARKRIAELEKEREKAMRGNGGSQTHRYGHKSNQSKGNPAAFGVATVPTQHGADPASRAPRGSRVQHNGPEQRSSHNSTTVRSVSGSSATTVTPPVANGLGGQTVPPPQIKHLAPQTNSIKELEMSRQLSSPTPPLRSRTPSSKIPVPTTPRTRTPPLNRDWTESTLASSVFSNASAASVETDDTAVSPSPETHRFVDFAAQHARESTKRPREDDDARCDDGKTEIAPSPPGPAPPPHQRQQSQQLPPPPPPPAHAAYIPQAAQPPQAAQAAPEVKAPAWTGALPASVAAARPISMRADSPARSTGSRSTRPPGSPATKKATMAPTLPPPASGSVPSSPAARKVVPAMPSQPSAVQLPEAHRAAPPPPPAAPAPMAAHGPTMPASPVLSMASIASSPRLSRAETILSVSSAPGAVAASVNGAVDAMLDMEQAESAAEAKDLPGELRRVPPKKTVPSLATQRSWAAIAGENSAHARGSILQMSSGSQPVQTPVSAGGMNGAAVPGLAVGTADRRRRGSHGRV